MRPSPSIDFDGGAEVGDGLFKMAVQSSMVPSEGEEELKSELLIEHMHVNNLRTIVIDGTALGEPVKGKISGLKEGDVSVLKIELEISAHADGGPRSRVCASETLRSAPHRRERKFSRTRVCRVIFKDQSFADEVLLKKFR